MFLTILTLNVANDQNQMITPKTHHTANTQTGMMKKLMEDDI